MIASIGLRNLPLRGFKTPKKCNKYLGLILTHLHMSRLISHDCSKGLNSGFFDSVQVQKYLNFISTENSIELLKSNMHQKIKKLWSDKLELERELGTLNNMASDGDKELEKLIQLERKEFSDQIEEIQNEILVCISAGNVDENRNVELQINSGIGGEEAKLFRKNLIQMYLNYAKFKNWECIHEVDSDHMLISGDFVYGQLKYEGGVHRVQRVPETEKQNRIHTSTCSVVILPQPEPHEIKINEKDLIVERMRSSGPGGQNVNKLESCIRITHIPSGIKVENQTSRFQYENKKFAIERLRGILFNIEQNKLNMEREKLIKGQAGTNDYSDKIRTYNFPQNRVTDHRLNYSTHDIKGFLSGTKDLDLMISKLREAHREKDLFDQIEKALQSTEYKNFEKRKG